MSWQLTWCASNPIGVSSIIRYASAIASVISWRAVCKSSTLAGVNTLLVLTFLCGRAIWVNQTFIRPAEVIRIANVIGLACAESTMTPGTAESIHTTILIQAGILAFSVIASKSEITL